MKVSLICTVKNEEENISSFLKSIVVQSSKPLEFIVVDGGSKDKTLLILKKFSKRFKWIKAYQKIGNISEGRNFAIKKSKNQIIAVCDAGGQYSKNWLQNLVRGFNGQVSFGMDSPLIKNDFQKVLAKTLLHNGVAGSSRNMIFLKKIWEEVGGYPEDLMIGEDTLFDERIKNAGYKISRIPDAICYWEMRKDYLSFKRQFYRYGYWDGVAYKKYGILPIKHKLSIIATSFLLLFFPIFYFLSLFSLKLKIKSAKRFYYLKGFLRGFFRLKE